MARRAQVRAAGRRYQKSDLGRTSHRHRQQRYRERQIDLDVTHQGGQMDLNPPRPSPPVVCRCAICGFQNRWIDPFPPIPRNLRRRRSPKSVSAGIKQRQFRRFWRCQSRRRGWANTNRHKPPRAGQPWSEMFPCMIADLRSECGRPRPSFNSTWHLSRVGLTEYIESDIERRHRDLSVRCGL